MKFLATRFELEGEFAEALDAASWEEAEKICVENDWRLDGVHRFTISDADMTEEKAYEIIGALNERDEATVQ